MGDALLPGASCKIHEQLLQEPARQAIASPNRPEPCTPTPWNHLPESAVHMTPCFLSPHSIPRGPEHVARPLFRF